MVYFIFIGKMYISYKKKLAEERKIAEAERKKEDEERWREENAAVLAKLRAEKESLRAQQVLRSHCLML